MSYDFGTLRYVHDVVVGEFANLGVVVYGVDTHEFAWRFVVPRDRLHAFFAGVDLENLEQMIEALNKALMVRLTEAKPLGLGILLKSVLPADDSSLQWHYRGSGTGSAKEALPQLFARYVREL